ncbi:MAG TPA: hypothetical protein VMH04_13905 [Candidatus Solibacter sp.]|nr:hypothetical protein [Candidatus Solibacter sp.]
MKFAKIIFWIAAVWGILVLSPLFFIYDMIGLKDPPPITHPAFYYGFASVALVWQFAFIVIARDPIRFRPMMIPSVLEKFGFGTACIVLFLEHRLHASDLVLNGIDLIFGVLFLAAYFRTPASQN